MGARAGLVASRNVSVIVGRGEKPVNIWCSSAPIGKGRFLSDPLLRHRIRYPEGVYRFKSCPEHSKGRGENPRIVVIGGLLVDAKWVPLGGACGRPNRRLWPAVCDDWGPLFEG